ncbi:unnamed protein product [Ixodes persulcatus]
MHVPFATHFGSREMPIVWCCLAGAIVCFAAKGRKMCKMRGYRLYSSEGMPSERKFKQLDTREPTFGALGLA